MARMKHPLPRARWEYIKSLTVIVRVISDGRHTMVTKRTQIARQIKGRARLARHERSLDY